MKTLKKTLKYLGFLILAVVLVFGGFLGYMTMRDYRPKRIEQVEIQNSQTKPVGDTVSVLTWNIGYCGLGKEQDFFFDEGKMVRPTKELNEKYQAGVISALVGIDSADVIMLQEVDRGSKRSYMRDQVISIADAHKQYAYGFATNYNSLFVPQPVTEPYGKCYGGLMTLSKPSPSSASRFALAPDAGWPVGLFMLKRCLMEFRYPLKNGKELVIINQHLSAYDDGTVKQEQLDTMKVKLLAEQAKGNYVIVGGDWNTYPPGYEANLKNKGKDVIVEKKMEAGYPAAGWKWAFDPSTPTNRKLYEPYKPGETDVVVIDYFLLSPNINVIQVKGIDLGFENSDHQPVYLKVILN